MSCGLEMAAPALLAGSAMVLGHARLRLQAARGQAPCDPAEESDVLGSERTEATAAEAGGLDDRVARDH